MTPRSVSHRRAGGDGAYGRRGTRAPSRAAPECARGPCASCAPWRNVTRPHARPTPRPAHTGRGRAARCVARGALPQRRGRSTGGGPHRPRSGGAGALGAPSQRRPAARARRLRGALRPCRGSRIAGRGSRRGAWMGARRGATGLVGHAPGGRGADARRGRLRARVACRDPVGRALRGDDPRRGAETVRGLRPRGRRVGGQRDRGVPYARPYAPPARRSLAARSLPARIGVVEAARAPPRRAHDPRPAGVARPGEAARRARAASRGGRGAHAGRAAQGDAPGRDEGRSIRQSPGACRSGQGRRRTSL